MVGYILAFYLGMLVGVGLIALLTSGKEADAWNAGLVAGMDHAKSIAGEAERLLSEYTDSDRFEEYLQSLEAGEGQ